MRAWTDGRLAPNRWQEYFQNLYQLVREMPEV
ncbi:hypothetical protein HNR72_007981 [Streptomyces collinus]|uniref:Uncharacterized protein n=1 Tax=Streptomyces collinus TaxID=42684 RepID=A0AA89QSX4_STRCU|nr:hypothetical protein [Streptomyces collinus]